MSLCRRLRWKGYHGETRTPFRTLADHPSSRHGPCTCLRTTQPWGPDGNLASVPDCQPTRLCWEKSPPRYGTWIEKILAVFSLRRP